ncbi:MAG: hypothetical protein AAB544_00930 [Patescibacteria group bacterium]
MNTNTTTNVLMAWTAPERPHVERGKRWYAAVGLFGMVSVIWSIATGAWTFTVVLILGGAMYFQHLRLHSPARRIEIRKEGICINDELTPWEQCAGFWIYKHEPDFVLHIEKSRGWDREFISVIEGYDHRDVATLLSAILPYRATRRENVLDSIIRICKL